MDAATEGVLAKYEECMYCFDDMFSRPAIQLLRDDREQALLLLEDVATAFPICTLATEKQHLITHQLKRRRGPALGP